MCAQESVLSSGASGEHVSVDDSHVVLCVIRVAEQSLQFLSHEHVGILRLLHLAAHERHSALQAHLTGEEQSSEEDYRRWVNRPNHLSLVHGSHVIHLHAHVSSRARTVEHVHLHIVGSRQRLHALLLRSDTEIRLRHLRQSGKSRLPFLLLSFQFEGEVGSQRFVPQCRHEDCLRL